VIVTGPILQLAIVGNLTSMFWLFAKANEVKELGNGKPLMGVKTYPWWYFIPLKILPNSSTSPLLYQSFNAEIERHPVESGLFSMLAESELFIMLGVNWLHLKLKCPVLW
jgi:hypothetical protein